jgi:hypothetical protein
VTRYTYAEQIEAVKQDLLCKFQRADWHGVSDCACDLRELEAEERGRASLSPLTVNELRARVGLEPEA